MSITRYTTTIAEITNLTPTAKEIRINLPSPMEFEAGSFVNLFMNINGINVRRAYSISSDPNDKDSITLAVRLSPHGTMTPLFWNKDMQDMPVELMGPLGLNTADNMTHHKIYLCGFGIGAGVVKSLAQQLVRQNKEITILIGSRTEEDIVYKEFFDTFAKAHSNVRVLHSISKPQEHSEYKSGYIQHHIEGLDFNNADVYICGQESACNELKTTILAHTPVDCAFFIEGFH